MEIRAQQFGKTLRGYNEQEVKNFLMRLAQDYENVYSENSQLRENNQRLKYELDRYHKLEETMNNSLILAQQTAEMLKVNAQKEADIILEDSKKRIAEILNVYQEVVKRLNLINLEIKAQISAEVEMMDRNQKRIEDLSNFLYSKDIKEILENLSKVQLKDET